MIAQACNASVVELSQETMRGRPFPQTGGRIRGTVRMIGVPKNTIIKLPRDRFLRRPAYGSKIGSPTLGQPSAVQVMGRICRMRWARRFCIS